MVADNPVVHIVHRGKASHITHKDRQLLKRRQAIEPIIGHLKADHRMGRCHLKGEIGDRLHAVLCAAGYNIRWLLRMILKKGLGLLLRLLQASGGVDLAHKLTQIIGHNRLHTPDQRWLLA